MFSPFITGGFYMGTGIYLGIVSFFGVLFLIELHYIRYSNNIVVEYIKAVKNKVCPIVEIKK